MYPYLGSQTPYIMHMRTHKFNYVTNTHMFGGTNMSIYICTYIHSYTMEKLNVFTHNLRMYNQYIWSDQNVTQWVCMMDIYVSIIYIHTWHYTVFYL